MMKCYNLLLALVVILLMASCKSANKTVIANQTDRKEFVVAVNKGNVNFESYFLDKTMRLDYFHAGTAVEEHFSTDRIVSDGIWSGSKKVLIDDLKLGLYFFEVIDKESKTLLYSRGFASIFGEWQTIPEASEKWGTFHGVFKRTPLTIHYSSFDSERYALSDDNRTIRDIASEVPYDLMVIMINERTYGGGGIYNLYTTVAADNKFSEYIMIHEMGHHMAALADEYYTSAVSYEVPQVKVEPWETNITAFFGKNDLKWKDLVENGTPLPTPWNKEEFDKSGYSIQKERDSLRTAMVPETVMEDLFTRQMNQENEYFAKEQYREKVGAFEGAGYIAKELYRSQIDCIMYTRHLTFCKVCSRSIENVINQYVK